MSAVRADRASRPASIASFVSDVRQPTTKRTWLQNNWPLIALAAGAIAIAIVTRRLVFPAFSWNRDEVAYLWQADTLGTGRIFATGGGAPDFFWPWLAGLREGGFFSHYTVGWAAVLLTVETVFGSPELALALGATMAVLGTYAFTRVLTDDRQLALVAATLMLASPIVVVQAGVYIAYLFSLGLGLFFGAALIGGLRRESRALLFVAGTLIGYLLVTRPFDAVLWGAPLFGYALVVSWRRWRQVRLAALWVSLALLPFVVFTLLYNHRVSGSFGTFPITAKDPLDTFGFGVRRLMPVWQSTNYTVSRAVRSVAQNFRTFPLFLMGGWLGAATAAVGLWLRRRERDTIALLALAAAFPVGYFFFWGSRLSSRAASLSGPIYYIPLYAPACIFIAAAIIAAWRRRRGLGIALCAVLAVTSIAYLAPRIATNHKISVAQQPWERAPQSLERDALVIVENSGPYLMHLNPFSRNPPDLDGRILYAVDRGPANLDLIAAHPHRQPYLERTSDPKFGDPVTYHDAPVPQVSLIPLRVLHGRTLTLRVRVSNPRGEPAVVTSLQVGERVRARTLATDAAAGAILETTWTLAPAGSAEAAIDGVVPVSEDLGEIRIAVATASTPEAARVGKQVQEQFFYRVDAGTGEMDVLHPSRKYTGRTVRDKLRLRQVDEIDGLDVELTLNR